MNYVVTIDMEIVGQMGYILPSKVLYSQKLFPALPSLPKRNSFCSISFPSYKDFNIRLFALSTAMLSSEAR